MKKQKDFLLIRIVFDARGSYVYLRAAYGVSTQRLARLRKAVEIHCDMSRKIRTGVKSGPPVQFALAKNGPALRKVGLHPTSFLMLFIRGDSVQGSRGNLFRG